MSLLRLNSIKQCVFVFFIIICCAINSFSQDRFICPGDSILLETAYTKKAQYQWLVSLDSLEWRDIPNANRNQFWLKPVKDAYYKVKVTNPNCRPVNSNINNIQLYKVETQMNYNIINRDRVYSGDTLLCVFEKSRNYMFEYNNNKKVFNTDSVKITLDSLYSKLIITGYDSNGCIIKSCEEELLMEPFYRSFTGKDYFLNTAISEYKFSTDSVGLCLLSIKDSISNLFNPDDIIIINDSLGGILLVDTSYYSSEEVIVEGRRGSIFSIFSNDSLEIQIQNDNTPVIHPLAFRSSSHSDFPHLTQKSQSSIFSSDYLDSIIKIPITDNVIELYEGIELRVVDGEYIIKSGNPVRSCFQVTPDEQFYIIDFKLDSIGLKGKLEITLSKNILVGTSINKKIQLYKVPLVIPLPGLPPIPGFLEFYWNPSFEFITEMSGKATIVLDYNIGIPIKKSVVYIEHTGLIPIIRTDYSIDESGIFTNIKTNVHGVSNAKIELAMHPYNIEFYYHIFGKAELGPYLRLDYPVRLTAATRSPLLDHDINIKGGLDIELGGYLDHDEGKKLPVSLKFGPYLIDTLFHSPDSIGIKSGNHQNANLGQALTDSISVGVYHSYYNPFQGEKVFEEVSIPTPVVFKVPKNSPDKVNGEKEIVVYTSEGVAHAAWFVAEQTHSYIDVSTSSALGAIIKGLPLNFETCITEINTILPTDTTVHPFAHLELTVEEGINSDIQWEVSFDNFYWVPIEGAVTSGFVYFPEESQYIRATYFQDGCDTAYSKVTRVIVDPCLLCMLYIKEIIPQSDSSITANVILSNLTDCHIIRKGLCYSSTESPTVNSKLIAVEEDTATILITGLDELTTYRIRTFFESDDTITYSYNYIVKTLEKDCSCPDMPTVTDIDGNVYNTFLFEDKCWLAEDLLVTRFNDGESIPLVTDSASWSNLESPGYHWDKMFIPGSFSSNMGDRLLYNWYVVETCKLCPSGWHVPSDLEWLPLENYLNMSEEDHFVFGNRSIDKELSLDLHWGKFSQYSGNTWWSSSKIKRYANKSTQAIYRYFGVYSGYRGTKDFQTGLPVRCVYGEPILPKVNTKDAYCLTSNSAIIGGYKGNIRHTCSVTELGIYWGRNEEVHLFGEKISITTTDTSEFITTLEDLSPGTIYYYRAYVKNEYTEKLGDMKQFTTFDKLNEGVNFNSDLTYGMVTDIDNNEYKTIQIGSQTWMAQNLATTRLNNGDTIDQNRFTDYYWDRWYNIKFPSYCWYDNNSNEYKNLYGALYNFYSVDTDSLCPVGWHVPTIAEFDTLLNYVISYGTQPNISLIEEGVFHWPCNERNQGNNQSGFTAVPIQRQYIQFSFGTEEYGIAEFWTAEGSKFYLTTYGARIPVWPSCLYCGKSVRCIKD